MAPSIHLFCSGTCTGPRCRHSLFSRASFQSPTAGRTHVPCVGDCRDRIRLKKRTEACSLGHWASRHILALSIRSKSEAVTDTCVAEERSCRARQAWQRPCCSCRNKATYCSQGPLRERLSCVILECLCRIVRNVLDWIKEPLSASPAIPYDPGKQGDPTHAKAPAEIVIC